MTTVIEIILGLGFVYLIFSTICSGIIEWASEGAARRRRHLFKALNVILGPPLAWRFVHHPAITGINRRQPIWHALRGSTVEAQVSDREFNVRRDLPTYIPPTTFALVLLDLRREDEAGGPEKSPRASKAKAELRRDRLIETFRKTGDAELLFRLEKWFAGEMRRVSGLYKRRTQIYTILVATLITVLFNVDSYRIAATLNRDSTLRATVADRAATAAGGELQNLKANIDQLVGVPIGWPRDKNGDLDFQAGWDSLTLAGWLVSIVAISLGAPFWFDVLNRLVNLRQTGRKPDGQFEA